MATDLEVRSEDQDTNYRLLQPIGRWGADFSFTVFEAIILPERNDPNTHVAIKVIGMDTSHYLLATDDIAKSDVFVDPPPEYILKPLDVFDSTHNNVPIKCIVLPFDNRLSSLRSLMQSHPQFAAGIPLDCIAFAFAQVLVALSDIHSLEELHSQLTAGNIFYDRRTRKIKVAFASSVYERDPPVLEETECPINTMLDWARPPEIEKDETTDFLYTFDSEESDTWFLGITALELAYGRIETSSRGELLQISRYISIKQDLPNTWEELRRRADADNINRQSPPKKRRVEIAQADRGLPGYFVDFVANCLATNPNARMSVVELQRHQFMRRHVVNLNYFEDVLVKGKAAPVAKIFKQLRRKDNPWKRRKPTTSKSILRQGDAGGGEQGDQ